MARRKKRTCNPNGLKANGHLKKGYRYAKGRKGCAVKAKG